MGCPITAHNRRVGSSISGSSSPDVEMSLRKKLKIPQNAQMVEPAPCVIAFRHWCVCANE